MAYQKRERETLAWMTLKADDTRLPDELRSALALLDDTKEEIENLVRKTLPPEKGKVWRFAYQYGVGIAQASASGTTSVDYFAKR